MVQILAKCEKIDKIVENVLATGNVPTTSDLGLMQETGKKKHIDCLSIAT